MRPWLLCFLMCFVNAASLQAVTWTQVAGPQGGNVQALAFSPNYASDGTLFALAGLGNFYKSSNHASSWSFLSAPTFYAGGFALSPHFCTDTTLFSWNP